MSEQPLDEAKLDETLKRARQTLFDAEWRALLAAHVGDTAWLLAMMNQIEEELKKRREVDRTETIPAETKGGTTHGDI